MKRVMEFKENTEERLILAADRIREIKASNEVEGKFRFYFEREAEILLKRVEILEKMLNYEYDELSYTELYKYNREMYKYETPKEYETSFVNPRFALKELGEEVYREFCHAAYLMERSHKYLFSGDIENFVKILELYLELYSIVREKEGEAAIKSAIYSFKTDHCHAFLYEIVKSQFTPAESNAFRVIMEDDLSKPDYLYKFGLFVGEEDEKVAKYLASLSDEKIKAMAFTHVNGFIEGYKTMGMDISKKSGVKFFTHLGFERLVKEEILQFRERGLKAFSILTNEGVNRQVDYDHKNDEALYLDEAYMEHFLLTYEAVLQDFAEELAAFAGPAAIETFGEEDFDPEVKEEAIRFDAEKRKLSTAFAGKKYQIFNRFCPAEKRSFSIIAYPLPTISKDRYEEIFDDIIRINNMDNEAYRRIQQVIIDALDKGDFVHVKGRGENRTDIKVKLHELKNPEKETNFENCVADVNIPVGEVFTSPMLTGTEGILHVSSVHLNGLLYKNLSLTFRDGKVAAYSVRNFEKEEDNNKFIEENLLFHHETLPIGEFAIGTNTLAYVVGIKYDINGKLPILIAEKTGPHFAIGDTCYSMQEDHRLFNPDGKEIVAKENECSSLRKTDITKAYFNCHTDITLPYSELGEITVISKDGSQVTLLKDGRFVLSGTEELNKPLEEL